MDVIIVIIIIGIFVFLFKRTFSSFVYATALSDIFLRIVAFLKVQLFRGDIYNFFNNNFPESIPAMINKYSRDVLNTVLIWMYVILMIVFEFYIIKTFIRKK